MEKNMAEGYGGAKMFSYGSQETEQGNSTKKEGTGTVYITQDHASMIHLDTFRSIMSLLDNSQANKQSSSHN